MISHSNYYSEFNLIIGCIVFRQSRFAKPRFANALTTLGLLLGPCTLNDNSTLAKCGLAKCGLAKRQDTKFVTLR